MSKKKFLSVVLAFIMCISMTITTIYNHIRTFFVHNKFTGFFVESGA